MQVIKTEIEGVHIIDSFTASDERGLFVKTFQSTFFKQRALDFQIRESYYSVSKKNVIRGMHFQLPPHDHDKLVYVVNGSIVDVLLDLRKASETYGKYISVNLSAINHKCLIIPKGIAHGFKSLEDDTVTIYNVSSEYNKNADSGVRFDSFGFDWEVEELIVSERDKDLASFTEFKSPF